MSTTERSGKQLCLYRDEDSQDLIGCYQPNLDQCTRVNDGVRALDNETDYNVKFYHSRCDDDDLMEDVQPGQQRSFDTPAYAYKAYNSED